jgi:hypothetical protein
LTRRYLFVFPDSGHGVFRTNTCARQVIAAFLADPGASPRLPCMDRLTGPVFALPDAGARPPAREGTRLY